MADGTLPLSPASPGGQIEDVEQLNIVPPAPPVPPAGQISVVRQRIQTVGRLYTQIAEVLSADPAAGDFGLVVRAVGAAKEVTLTASNVLLTAIRDRLPAALVGGRLDTNIGAWLGSTAPTVGQKAMAASIPVVLPSDQATEDSPLIVQSPRAFYDAFGRFRASEPLTLFDSKQLVNKQPLFWDDQLVSGAGGASTYNTNQASTTLSVAAATAGNRVRQTFQRFNYQPGKSQMWMMTGIIGTPAAGITRNIGSFDAKNGLFWQSAPATMNIVTRSFTSGVAVNTAVAQAAWNIDKLNGAGPSGITADWSTTQIFGCFFEWLGVGSTWFFVVIGGQMILVHRVDHSNLDTLVYMSVPNLPLRYEITNDGTGGAASITHVCTTVISEGGKSDSGIVMSTNRGATALVTLNNANNYPLLAFRLGSTFLTSDIKLLSVSIVCTNNAAFNWQLILNPTVVGAALAFTPITNSSLEFDVGTTNATTVTGGTVLQGGTSQQTNEAGGVSLASSDIRLGSTIAGVSDIIVLAVQRVTGTAETFYGALDWRDTQ